MSDDTSDDTEAARDRQLLDDVRELLSRHAPGLGRLTVALSALLLMARDGHEIKGEAGGEHCVRPMRKQKARRTDAPPSATLDNIDPVGASKTHVMLRCLLDDEKDELQPCVIYLPRVKYFLLLNEYLDGKAGYHEAGGAFAGVLYAHLTGLRPRQDVHLNQYDAETDTVKREDVPAFDCETFEVEVEHG